MENRKQGGGGLADDIASTIGAIGLGVPKHMIAGYFFARFLERKRQEATRVELENRLNEHEHEFGRTPAFLEVLAEFESIYGPRKNTVPPSVAATLRAEATDGRVDHASDSSRRAPRFNVNWRRILLFVGILLAPYIFAWFTLRSGYSMERPHVSEDTRTLLK
ncbi:hypothetical protein ACNRC9_10315 [Ralstonia pseudosolanacearum]|uniref:hypothetical protein n=1 Tax=Ralstonia pseudosolanacearum TaxID=1310165 RepID=UPI003AAF2D32